MSAIANHHAQTPVAIDYMQAGTIDEAITAIIQAISRIRKHQTVGAYLYIDHADSTGRHAVYVLSETHSSAALWILDHFDWLVALYAPMRPDGNKRNPDGTKYMTATREGIAEDIGAHLADLERKKC